MISSSIKILMELVFCFVLDSRCSVHYMLCVWRTAWEGMQRVVKLRSCVVHLYRKFTTYLPELCGITVRVVMKGKIRQQSYTIIVHLPC